MLATLLLLSACGGGDQPDDGVAVRVDAGSLEDRAQYLAAGTVVSPAGRSGYGALINSLAEDTVIDIEETSVFPGVGSLGVLDDGSGQIFVGSAESARITRFEAAPDNSVTATGELSVQPTGAFSAAGLMVVVSPRRGYLFSAVRPEVIVFDPTAMELVGGIPVALEPRSFFGDVAFEDDGRLVAITLSLREDASVVPRTRAVIIDTATDEVSYADHDGCGGMRYGARDAEGNMYFAPLLRQAAAVLTDTAGEPASPACVLRLPTGASSFDPEVLDLLELTGGRPAGTMAQGAGNTAYILVYNEDAPPVTPETAAAINTEEVWSYRALDLTDPTALQPVPGLAGLAGLAASFAVVEGDAADPTPFLVRSADGFGMSTLIDISDPAAPRARFTAPGSLLLLFRLR